MNESEKQELKNALRSIGLALHFNHNTVATDAPDQAAQLEQKPGFWRVNHAKEIAALDTVERYLSRDNGL